jgi:hypothetical protein
MPIKTALQTAVTLARDGVLKPLERPAKLDDPHDEPTVLDLFGTGPAYAQALGTPFVDGVTGTDVDQGQIGDCFFMASLSAVAQTHPELIQNAIRDNHDGTYTVTLHEPVAGPVLHRAGWLGEKVEAALSRLAPKLGTRPVEVTVDAQLPNGGSLDAHSPMPGELWPALMEKAYAKLWGGSYAAINGGDAAEALKTLTGGEHHAAYTRFSNDDRLFDFVKQALDAKQPLTAASKGLSLTGGTGDIVKGHVYSIVGAGEENGQRYVELRNPWGYDSVGDYQTTKRICLDELREKFCSLDTVKLPAP